MTSTPTRRLVPVEAIEKLQSAVWQALDDMGTDGQCVCGATKHLLQCAYLGEPYVESEIGKFAGREIHVDENDEAIHETAASPNAGRVTEAEMEKAYEAAKTACAKCTQNFCGDCDCDGFTCKEGLRAALVFLRFDVAEIDG